MQPEKEIRPAVAMRRGTRRGSLGPVGAVVGTTAGTALLAGSLVGLIAGLRVAPPRDLSRALRRALAVVMRAYGIEIQVVGGTVPNVKGRLLMANHTAWLDHLITFVALGHYMIGLDAVENLRVPIYGTAARAWGQIPIDRSDHEAARASCAAVRKALEDGTPVLVFPEGTRTMNGEVGPFKKGVFHAAIGARAVVLPIALEGLREIAPRGSRLVRAGTVRLHVGAPIDTVGLAASDMPALMSEVRTQMLAMLGMNEMGGVL